MSFYFGFDIWTSLLSRHNYSGSIFSSFTCRKQCRRIIIRPEHSGWFCREPWMPCSGWNKCRRHDRMTNWVILTPIQYSWCTNINCSAWVCLIFALSSMHFWAVLTWLWKSAPSNNTRVASFMTAWGHVNGKKQKNSSQVVVYSWAISYIYNQKPREIN